MIKTEKTAFMLMAFGGADSIENIEPFLKNIIKGRPVTEEMVARTKDRYSLIGGRSPLLAITVAQAKAIGEILKAEGVDYPAYVGMRYWKPYIKDTLTRMKADGVERVIGLVMTPFSTTAATGGYEEDVKAAQNEIENAPRVEFIPGLHLKSFFIETIADFIKEELKAFDNPNDALVILSCHSLPMTLLEGDPYELVIQQSSEKVMALVKSPYKLAFQSKGAGPKEWKGPSTEDMINFAKKSGKKGVVVVPFGFIADHIETLYDIDIVFKGLAESKGLVFKRTPSLNTNPRFIAGLADVIKKFSIGTVRI